MGINKNIRGTCHQYQHKHGWLMLIGMCTTTSEARIWCQFWNNKSKSQIGERSILLPPISNISGLTTIHSEKTQDGYLISLLSLGKILFQTHQLCSQVQLRSLFHSITNSQRYDDTSQAVGEDSLPQLRFSSKHSPGQTKKKDKQRCISCRALPGMWKTVHWYSFQSRKTTVVILEMQLYMYI